MGAIARGGVTKRNHETCHRNPRCRLCWQRIDGKLVAFIKRGLLVSVAFASEDEGAHDEMIKWAVRKILNARLYDSQSSGSPTLLVTHLGPLCHHQGRICTLFLPAS